MGSKKRKQRRKEALKARKQQVAVKKPEKKAKSIFLDIYTKDYKKLMIIPVVLLLISVIILFARFAETGEFINKGVSIKGGISLTISTSTLSAGDVKQFLEKTFPDSDIETRTLSATGEQAALIVEASEVEADALVNSLKLKYGLSKDDYTLEITGSSLGRSFYRQMIIAIIFAFIFMGIVVYFYFRTIIPSLAIMLAAFSDMIITLAVVSLMDLRITAAGIAAFLMLIGYSVDTDILLTTRVLKRKGGSLMDRVLSAVKTGMTMNVTTLAAVITSLLVSQSEVIKQIMTILLIGLIADIINTWIQNAGLLRWYIEKREGK